VDAHLKRCPPFACFGLLGRQKASVRAADFTHAGVGSARIQRTEDRCGARGARPGSAPGAYGFRRPASGAGRVGWLSGLQGLSLLRSLRRFVGAAAPPPPPFLVPLGPRWQPLSIIGQARAWCTR